MPATSSENSPLFSPQAAAWPALSGTTIGILAFVTAVTVGATQAGTTKFLTATLGAFMIVWGRYVGSFLVLFPIALARHGTRALVPPEPGIHLLRGILILGAAISYVMALRGMPLADASAVAYVYPFLVTALAPVFLGEKVSRANWLAVTAGFFGVLIVVRPSFGSVDLHALLALDAGACYAISLLLTRTMTARTPALIMSTSTAFIGAMALSCALPWIWQTLDPTTILLLGLVGLLTAVGQLLATYACSKAPMPTLAPFGYCEIISATAIGLLLFGDFPDATTWTGIGLIALSGMFIAMSSRTSAVPAKPADVDPERSRPTDLGDEPAVPPGLRLY